MVPSNLELSEDSKVILLLCSDLIECKEFKKFSVDEWNILAKRIANSEIKTPSGFYNIKSSKWGEVLGLNENIIRRIEKRLTYGIQLGFELERLSNKGIWVITRAEKAYPSILKRKLLYKSPIVLYGSGDIEILNNKKIAIVGSRDIDIEEVKFIKKLVKKSIEDGFTIVSGGSRGTDSVAETTALEYGGKAVSILSEELEKYIFKKEVRNDIMCGKRLIMSPYKPDIRFLSYNALGRNKYIYALSDYSVVISAIENKGGTWSGAIENLERGFSPMFVKVGSKSGNNKLINMGVKLLDDDTLENQFSTNWLSENIYKKNENVVVEQLGFDEIKKIQEVKREENIFDIIWPIIEKKLNNDISVEQLSANLDIKKVQLIDWLNKAEKKGYVKKMTKPVRYIKS